LPLRTDGTGKTLGGGLISRGHLYKILSNPIYLGRLPHRGQVHDGLHASIIDREIWDRVQLLLAEHAQRTAGGRQNSDGLLAGKLFDDRGNPMSPSHAAKGGRRYRYYVSQAILQGRKHEAGSVARVPALEIEARVAEAVRAASAASNRHGGHQLLQPKASGHHGSTNCPTARPSGYAATLRAAIERGRVARPSQLTTRRDRSRRSSASARACRADIVHVRRRAALEHGQELVLGPVEAAHASVGLRPNDQVEGLETELDRRGVDGRVSAPVDEGPEDTAVAKAGRTATIQASLKARNSASVISPEAIANTRWRPPVTCPAIGTL
jgi:hypothetical protein